MKKLSRSTALSKPIFHPFLYCLPAVSAGVLTLAFLFYGEGYAAILPGALLGLTAAFLASAQGKPLAYDPLPALVGFALCAMGVVFGKFVTFSSFLTAACRQPLWNFLGGVLLTSAIQPMGKKDWKRTLLHLLPVLIVLPLLFTIPRLRFDMEFSLFYNLYFRIHGLVVLLAPLVIGLCLPVHKPEKGARVLTIAAAVLLAVLVYAYVGQTFSHDLPLVRAFLDLGKKPGMATVGKVLLTFYGMTLRK